MSGVVGGVQALLLLVFVLTIVAQAARPTWRTEIVVGGGGIALLLTAAAGREPGVVLATLPWDVLVILAALGVVSRIFGDSRLFIRLAVSGTRLSRADPTKLVAGAAVAMFLTSSLVNNITALMLVLPIIIAILELIGTTARHLRWTIGVLLVSCNLGGAATPIGDFPAILLLGDGVISFTRYLTLAFPIAVSALVVVLVIVHVFVKPARDVDAPPLRRALTIAAVDALHRRIRLDVRVLVPALVTLAGMLAAWILLPAATVGPHLVAWIGATVALVLVGKRAPAALKRGVDVDATLFLFGLFVLVGDLATGLAALPVTDDVRLFLLVAITGIATGLFSAGPSMAAMLEVGRPLTSTIPPDAVYIGLAFAVCAGSSLLITAATSGPLAQGLIERAGLVDEQGRPLRFTFQGFLPVGILSFVIILTTAFVAVTIIASSAHA
jgi:Na+/H+ antiporter NhaD/arsenite permease-like protein